MPMDEAFDVLGISPDSTYLVAQRAYRARARMLHPDVVDASRRVEAAAAMARTNVAWARIRSELRPPTGLVPVADTTPPRAAEDGRPDSTESASDAPSPRSRWKDARRKARRSSGFGATLFGARSGRSTVRSGIEGSEATTVEEPAPQDLATDEQGRDGFGPAPVDVDGAGGAPTAGAPPESGDAGGADLPEGGPIDDARPEEPDTSDRPVTSSPRRRRLVAVVGAAAAIAVVGVAATSLTGAPTGPEAYVGECLNGEGTVVGCSTGGATHRVDSVEADADDCTGPVFASRSRDAFFCTTVL